jgi:hypothetical protein
MRPAQDPAAKSGARGRAAGDGGLGELLLALYRGVREPDGWLDFQRKLSLSLDTVNSVLSLRWPEGTRPGLTYTYNGDAARLPPALRAYVAIDPFVNIAEGRAVRLLDLVDPTAFRSSTYYREWLVPIGVEYALGLDVRETGRFHARLRLCRARSAGEFTDADCRLVESLGPHLRLAVGIYSELDEARSGRELYADAMDSLTLATIVLDEHGRMVHANRLAEACSPNAMGFRSAATAWPSRRATTAAASASSSAVPSMSSRPTAPLSPRPCACRGHRAVRRTSWSCGLRRETRSRTIGGSMRASRW